jgi:hypothetical protein
VKSTKLKSNYSKKELRSGPDAKVLAKLSSLGLTQWLTNVLHVFLGILFDTDDGLTVTQLKERLRRLYISGTFDLVVEDEKIDEIIETAVDRGLAKRGGDQELLQLTKKGRRVAQNSFHLVLHHEWWSNMFMRENVVLIVTAIVLFILSAVKILTGLRIGSDAMLTEGAENLTDFLKIGIIFAGIRLNRTRLASWIIIGMMLLTGGGMLWSSIASLVSPALRVVAPGIVAYIVVVLSLVLNYVLMVYKGLVGRISGNLSLLSDAKDSEINIVISLGVLAGFLFAILNLQVVDTIVGVLIALFCIKEAISLAIEVYKQDETFDITNIKVNSDRLYENRLTGYLLGSIHRRRLSADELQQDFSDGLALGRLYYRNMADYCYTDIGAATVRKHLELLIKQNLVSFDEKDRLYLTNRGLKAFYKAKSVEYDYHSRIIGITGRSFWKLFGIIIRAKLLYLVFFVIVGLLIVFADQIKAFISMI